VSIGRITRALLTVVALVLVLWASIAALWGGPGDTISETLRDYGAAYPIIPFAAGVVAGHWWWVMRPAVPRDHLTRGDGP
jgi:peptidoglycan/LPS O-acetylase OafA/YrhL